MYQTVNDVVGMKCKLCARKNTLKSLMGKHASKPANPLLANAFFRTGYIESWGRGIEKMRCACREHDIPPPIYDFNMSGLMLTFQANPAHLQTATPEAKGVKSPVEAQVKMQVKTRVKTPVKILQLLQTHPEMTLAEVAETIGKSLSAVERASSKLVKEGLLRHVGPQKGGRWEVTKKQ